VVKRVVIGRGALGEHEQRGSIGTMIGELFLLGLALLAAIRVFGGSQVVELRAT